MQHPMRLDMNAQIGSTFVAAAPREVTLDDETDPSPPPPPPPDSSNTSVGSVGSDSAPFGSDSAPFRSGGRTFDEEGIVSTILGAKKSVSLAVMNFLPLSIYSPPAETVW
jgi:hypothetical protein